MLQLLKEVKIYLQEFRLKMKQLKINTWQQVKALKCPVMEWQNQVYLT